MVAFARSGIPPRERGGETPVAAALVRVIPHSELRVPHWTGSALRTPHSALDRSRAHLAALAALAMLASLAAASCKRTEDPGRAVSAREAEARLRRLVPPATALPHGCTYAAPAGRAWPYPVRKNPHVTADAAPARAMAARWGDAFDPAEVEAVLWCLLEAGGDLGTEAALFGSPASAEQAAYRIAERESARPTVVLYEGGTVAIVWRSEGAAPSAFAALVDDARGALGAPTEARARRGP